ncbi:uncharacterized protein LOC143018587 [Oratosquilla oratoria]|uniref:uncharacterized protein LOC143018587 n=1 Tax=Oratosquilla oratoria TaxID=337810 RepID=UPI003F76025F
MADTSSVGSRCSSGASSIGSGSRSGSLCSAKRAQLELKMEEGEDKSEGRQGYSAGLATFFLVAQMGGAGFLALPRAMADAGWIGIPLLVIFCVSVGYAGTRLGECWVIMEKRWKEYQEPVRQPYMDIAYRSFGMIGRQFVLVCVMITLFGYTIVYTILIAEFMAELVPDLTKCAWIGIVAASMLPLTWLGTPKDFWQSSVLAVCSTVLCCLVIFIELILEAPRFEVPKHPNPTFASFSLGFGAILFSYGGASVFPTIQNDMGDRSQFWKSVTAAFAVILMLYLPVGATGYILIGNAVSDNILTEIDGVVVHVAMIMQIINLIGTYVISFNPISQTFEDFLAIPNRFCWKRCALRTSIVVFEVFIGLAVPQFGKILNLVGGSTITLCSFVLPPLCYMKLCSLKKDNGEPERQLPLWEKAYLWEIIVVGLVGGVASTITALYEIFKPGAFDGSCFS